MKSSSRVKGPPLIEPVRCSGSEPSSSEKKKVCDLRIVPELLLI